MIQTWVSECFLVEADVAVECLHLRRQQWEMELLLRMVWSFHVDNRKFFNKRSIMGLIGPNTSCPWECSEKGCSSLSSTRRSSTVFLLMVYEKWGSSLVISLFLVVKNWACTRISVWVCMPTLAGLVNNQIPRFWRMTISVGLWVPGNLSSPNKMLPYCHFSCHDSLWSRLWGPCFRQNDSGLCSWLKWELWKKTLPAFFLL